MANNLRPPNIDASAATAWRDILTLALQMGSQANQQRWRSEEAEKERQFRESSMYIQNMLGKEALINESILEAGAEAAQFGYSVEKPMKKLEDLYISEGGQNLMNLSKELKAKRYSDRLEIHSELQNIKGNFRKGVNLAYDLDENRNEIFDENERTNLLAAEILGGMDPKSVLPESLVEGVRYGMSDPSTRLGRLQLEGEKTKQDAFKLEMERQKTIAAQTTSKFQLDLTKMYRDDNISSMSIGKSVVDKKTGAVTYTRAQSYGDYQIASGIHQYFKGMTKPEIIEMIENSPVSYMDRVPDELDYSDLEAITPQMQGYVVMYLHNRPDAQEFLGITSDDFATGGGPSPTASDEFNFAVTEGVRNAMSGFEQNPNYQFKTEFAVTAGKAAEYQAQEGMTKDLQITFQSTIPTLQKHFIDPIQGVLDIENKIKPIAKVLKKDDDFMARVEASGMNVVPYITSIIQPLLSQADPTTVNLLVTNSEDIKKILETSGLRGMNKMINEAIAAKGGVSEKYTPVPRLSVPERKRIKKVNKENRAYVENILTEYKDEIASTKTVEDHIAKWGDEGVDLASLGYGPESLPAKTKQLQLLSLELLKTTDEKEISIIKNAIELLQIDIDNIPIK